MKPLVIAVLWCAGLQAQSIVITSPAANQVLSGFNGFAFSVTVTGLSNTTRVCYQVDGYPASQQGQNAIAAAGCSIVAPFSLTVNTFAWFNGPHQGVAVAYDALGNLLATSAGVGFTVQNTWPVSYGPTLTVTPSTSFGSIWSGVQTVALTLGGAGASHSHSFNCFIDGTVLDSSLGGNASATCSYDTRAWSNASHQVCWTVTDNPGGDGTSYPGDGSYAGQHAEGCRPVAFSNSSRPYFVKANAREVFIQPGGTSTLTCTGFNTDGSSSSPGCAYFTSDPANCPVNQSTGVVAIASSPTAGNCVVYVQWPAASGTFSFNGICVASSTPALSYANINNIFNITGVNGGGGGLSTGFTYITHLDSGGTELCSTFGNFGSGSTGTFTIGPSRKVWFLIASSNVLPHFGSDGQIHNSFVPGTSLLVNSLFSTFEIAWQVGMPTGGNEPPYNPGLFADVQNSGFNAFETSANCTDVYSYSTSQQAQFQTDQANCVNGAIANFSNGGGCPKCFLHLIGESVTGDLAEGSGVYPPTYGPPSTWNPSLLALTATSWKNTGRVIGMTTRDEVTNAFGGYPLYGPWKVGTNNWTNIASNGSGTCTFNGSAGLFGTLGPNFIITGSTIANLNSVSPNTYTNPGGYPFNFSCPGVAAGTYNSSNDPALTIQQFGNQWHNYGGVNDFVHYDWGAKLRQMWTSVSNYPPMSFPPAASASTGPIVANWLGNGLGSLSGVSQMSDWCEVYTDVAIPPFLSLRMSSPGFITFADTLRQLTHGVPGSGCNPTMARSTLAGVTSASYGFESYDTDTVVSCVGNLITFTNPHPEMININMGRTRIAIAGSTDSNCNHHFYVIDTPTPTTAHVALIATSFTGTSNGGTVTFHDGYTTTIAASDLNNMCGGMGAACGGGTEADNASWATGCLYGVCADPIQLAGSPDSNIPRKRGQTFTIAGSSLSGFNGPTFFVPPEMSNTAANVLWYRQIPSTAGTGGTVTIWPDGLYVKGRNGSQGYDFHPGGETDQAWLSYMNGMSMVRFYQFMTNCNSYASDGTLYGACLDHKPAKNFTDTTTNQQHGMNAHFENGFAVPIFHANSLAMMLLQAKAKYILNPHLNSPDCGSLTVECAALSGTVGKALMGVNLAQANQSVTLDYTPYTTSGQQIARFNVTENAIRLTVLAANTTGETLLLGPDEKVLVLFPITFTGELRRPSVSARLADVPNAAKVLFRYGYDPYTLDAPAGTVFDCGDMSAACTPPVDLYIGPVYYRLIYLSAGGAPLALGDVQTLQ